MIVPTGAGGITVSTLKEAEQFFAAGYRDILYAVGIAPSKLDHVTALRSSGCDLTVILDNIEAAHAVAGRGVPALIEIDSDGHRAGVKPGDARLLEIGRVLGRPGVWQATAADIAEHYIAHHYDEVLAHIEKRKARRQRGAVA